MAGSADAQVGEVGTQIACAAGSAGGREGHGVIRIQRSGQRRGELDVGEVGQGATCAVCGWHQCGVHFLIGGREYARKIEHKLIHIFLVDLLRA